MRFTGEEGNLAAAEGAAHRLRVVLEGTQPIPLAGGRSLTPTVELGLRHDFGDAETGFGLEVGGRIAYVDPALGLTVEGTIRGLVAHEDDAYDEWGASANIRVAPGLNGHGLSVSLQPTWGVAQSGVQWTLVTTSHRWPCVHSERATDGPCEYGSGLWPSRLERRTSDPLCGHGAHGRTGPDVPGRNPVTSGQRVGTRPRIEPGRRSAGIAWGTTCKSGDTTASGLGVLIRHS